MNAQDVFKILEIEPTNDRRAIKKAYAGLVKKYHPEEQPDKWREIYDAYTVALKIAECGQRNEPVIPMSGIENPSIHIDKEGNIIKSQMEERWEEEQRQEREQSEKPQEEQKKEGQQSKEQYQQKGQPQRSAEMEEMGALFDDIEHLSSEQRRQNEQMQREEIQKAIGTFQNMLASKERNQKAWEDFFNQDDILPLISHKEFLLQFGDCLANQKINAKLCQFLKEQLHVIERYHADRNIVMADSEFSDVVRYAEKRIDAAHWANIAAQAKDTARQNKRNRFLNAIMGIAVFAIFGTVLTILAILVMGV